MCRQGSGGIDAGEHLGLARKVVADFLRAHPEHGHLADDLLSAAYLGLVEAARRHDGRDETWSAYACRYARGNVCIAVRLLAYPTKPSFVGGVAAHPASVSLSEPFARTAPAFEEYCGREVYLEEALPSNAPDPEAQMIAGALAADVDGLLRTLDSPEREVVGRRFGIGHRRARSRAQVAGDMWVTEQCIETIEGRAIEKLRRAAKQRGG